MEDRAVAALNPEPEERIQVGDGRGRQHDGDRPWPERDTEQRRREQPGDGDVDERRRHGPRWGLRQDRPSPDMFFPPTTDPLTVPSATPREQLAERIAGEVVVSDDPGATLRKWRTDFDITQTALATHLDVSPSVLSDYENGRRNRPGIGFINRYVTGLLAIDDAHGGDRIRQFARVLDAGFSGDAVLDIREYDRAIDLGAVLDAVAATTVSAGDHHRITGHTIIDSIAAITTLSSDEFYRLFGHSTNRLLVFTNVTTGEGPQVALRVVEPSPTAVVLHGIGEATLWAHAQSLASRDQYTLAVTEEPLEAMQATLTEFP